MYLMPKRCSCQTSGRDSAVCAGAALYIRNKANGPMGRKERHAADRAAQPEIAAPTAGAIRCALSWKYHLGYDSIKKIVRKYGKERL